MASRHILDCLKGQGGGDMKMHRLTLGKVTRDFCCLASHASDTHTVQKEHLFFKLFQNAGTVKASVIFSCLLSFLGTVLLWQWVERKGEGKGLHPGPIWWVFFVVACCLFVFKQLSSEIN